MEKRIIQVEEKVPVKMLIPLSIQHMFAMFGASVLVPFLFGINPAIVLLMNGVGTLLFIFITKGKAPAYLGSSFAFLSPALLVISKYGYEYALGGFVVLGIAGMCVAFIVRQCGTDWIDIVLPTAAMGPVVALIGLELAGNAASTAGLLDEKVDPKNVIVFLVTLGVAVFGQILFRGFLSVIPILIAIIVPIFNMMSIIVLEVFRGQKPKPLHILGQIAKNPLVIASVLGVRTSGFYPGKRSGVFCSSQLYIPEI